MHPVIDEKVQVEDNQHPHPHPQSELQPQPQQEQEQEQDQAQDQQRQIINSPLLPSYDYIVQTPPPPSYLQSTTRLYYKNRPFISDCEELTFHQEQERQRSDNQSDTWSEILKLPLRQRISYYIRSWSNTVYDGRLIFFAFFVFASLTTLAVVITVVATPNLLKH